MTFPSEKDSLVVDGRIGRRRFPSVGTILDGTELTGLTLNLGLNFANPAIGLLAKSFALGLYSIPNTGSADANADYVYLPSLQSINNFVVDGQAYRFELRGFDNVRGDGHLNSSASEFHVREGQSATADVFGVPQRRQRSPSSLCVWSDKRQRGRSITSAIAAATFASPAASSSGWSRKWRKPQPSTASRSVPACGQTSFSSSPERCTVSLPALGLIHTQSMPGCTGSVPLLSIAIRKPAA